MRGFRIQKDEMGVAGHVIVPSSHRVAIPLMAGVARSVTVPAGAGTVLFAATAPFWAQYGAAAVLPTGDVLDGTAPELNPAARWIRDIVQIGLVAAEDCTVSLSFYR